jgi:formate hydrogenlyase subunit 4
MDKEPTLIVQMITGAVVAVSGLLVAFGINMTDDQQTAVIAAIGPVVAVVYFVAGLVIRSKVTPVEKAEEAIDEAYAARQGIDPKPELT